jgi:hypothetical protein
MALEAGSFGYEGLMKKKKHNWALTAFIGGAIGAIGWFTYQKMNALPEIADPWAGPMARQATNDPLAGLGLAGLGCGCNTPIRGY